MDALPPTIPLFPLPNAVLFPRMLLPLHVFEERYRKMVHDALGGAKLIGMVLLRGDWANDYYGRPDIFPTGTVGEISQCERLDDGRYNILLLGLREFVVEEEFGDRTYRYARVRWRSRAEPSLPVAVRADLKRLACAYLERSKSSALGGLVAGGGLDDEVLVNTMCQVMDLAPVEKLWLLEAPDLDERVKRLRQVLEFCIEESRGGPGPAGRDRWSH